jgi:hypothetical protein
LVVLVSFIDSVAGHLGNYSMLLSKYMEFSVERERIVTSHRDVNSTLTNATDSLLPFYLNYLGGKWDEATQCMVAGDNGWNDNHAALNGDLNNKWALNNTPWSWGYFKRAELPVHFAIAEGWTVGDMYQVSLIFKLYMMFLNVI